MTLWQKIKKYRWQVFDALAVGMLFGVCICLELVYPTLGVTNPAEIAFDLSFLILAHLAGFVLLVRVLKRLAG